MNNPISIKWSTNKGKLILFVIALLGTVLICLFPPPEGLSRRGLYAIATTFFAAFLWVTGALPLPVTALSIPASLTVLGVYADIDSALAGFSNHLIFLFIVGFMLANLLGKYEIDRRIALYILSRMGSSPRLLILAVMIATAFLSMWVSNTATTAMMAPIALGLLAQLLGREGVKEEGDPAEAFPNFQVSLLLGTAYGASVGGIGTLIGSPPNAVVAAQLEDILNYQITFTDWLMIGLPVVFLSLPLVWYVLTFWLYPPRIKDVGGAREKARQYLREEGELDKRGKRAAGIFLITAFFWVLGGLDFLFEGLIPSRWQVTLFGGEGAHIFGSGGHQGVFYYVLVGLCAVPAMILTDCAEWEDLVDINWGTILLFGGGLSLAGALSDTGATKWIASGLFQALSGAPMILLLAAVIFFVIWLTNVTSNTATTAILAPVLIGIGGTLSATVGLPPSATAVFLSASAAIAASHAFALPVATPPNAIVFGTDRINQSQMMKAGTVLNLIMTVVLTAAIFLLFKFFWPLFLW